MCGVSVCRMSYGLFVLYRIFVMCVLDKGFVWWICVLVRHIEIVIVDCEKKFKLLIILRCFGVIYF